MMLLGLLLHAAVPNAGIVCGPAVPDRGVGAAHPFIARAPIIDKRGEQRDSQSDPADSCKADGIKDRPKSIGIPVLKAPNLS